MKLLKGRYGLYLVGCIIFALQNLMGNVVTGQLYRTVIRLGEGERFKQALISLGWLILILILVSGSIWLGKMLLMKAYTGAEHALRGRLVRRICHMPFALWTQKPAGDWINLFSRDTDVAMEGYKQKVVSIVTQGLSCIGGAVLVLSQNVAMGLFCIGCGILYYGSIFVLKKPTKRVQTQFWKSLEKGSRALAEMTKGISVIRFYQLSQYFHGQYTKVMEEAYAVGRRQVRISALAQTSKNFGYSFSYVGSLIFGLVLVGQGQIDIADLMYLWSLGMGISYGIQSLGFQFIELQENLTAAERVQEGLAMPEEASGEKGIATQAPDIVLQDVHFGYTEERPILQGVSCHIKAGEKVAIVGLSGSGKTTMIKLMLGLLSPTAGTVEIGGINGEELRKESLRSQFAYLPQMPFMLDDTMEANLRLVNDRASHEQLLAACESAGLKGLIDSLPEGLQTQVGENGKALSGGERQRLGVARCLVKDSPIMIMDEMTSALDVGLEEEVVRALFGLKDKTIICITHRLKAAELADRVLYMKEGRIVEA